MTHLRSPGAVLSLLVGLSFTSVGCGGSADSDSNSDKRPRGCSTGACGGDIVGTWEVDALCEVDLGALEFEGCPEIEVDGSGLTATGTMTFNSDGSASQDITLAGSFSFLLPEECLTFGDITVTCEQLDQLVKQDLEDSVAAGEPQDVSAIGCSGSSNCRCVSEMIPQNQVDVGTYTVTGNSVTTMDANGEGSSSEYCVDGDTLTLIDPGDSESASVTVVLSR